jgi:hypothetical protein
MRIRAGHTNIDVLIWTFARDGRLPTNKKGGAKGLAFFTHLKAPDPTSGETTVSPAGPVP